MTIPADRRTERLPAGRWSRAGETDSPVAPSVLDAIRRRPAATIPDLLNGELAAGGTLAVVGRRLQDLDALSEWIATVTGRRPLVVDLEGAVWRGGLAATIEGAGATGEGHGRRALLALRPDLALEGDRPVDPLRLRAALAAWPRRRPGDWAIATLSPLSLAARHPLPGTVVFEPLQAEAGDTDEEGAATPLAAALGRGASDAELVAACYATFCAPVYEPFFPATELVDAARGARNELSSLFDRLVAAALDGGSVEGRRSVDAGHDSAATVGLYCLLARAANGGPRAALAAIELERWFCLLRARSYETLAAASASMRGEQLPGVNLSQAPPLEFCDLRDAVLDEADLYRLNLADGDLRGASLRDADLARAHLKEADLRNADLRGADLTYSSLEQADLRGARLNGADLAHAFLDDALGLDPV